MTTAIESLSDIAAQIRAGKYEEGRAALDGTQETEENRAEFLFLRGFLKELTYDREEAVAVYKEVLEVEPHFAEAAFRAAVLCDQFGDDAAAIEYYEWCVSESPASVNALLNLAVMYEERGDLDDAERCVQDVLQSYPNHKRARRFLESVESSHTMVYNEHTQKERERHSALLDQPISDFELSVRSRNCLRQMNIRTLGDLLKTSESELLSYKNFGETSLHEIKAMLTQKNLRLGQALQAIDAAAGLFKTVVPESAETPVSLGRPIAELELSVRSRKALQRLGVNMIGELTQRSEAELMAVKNFGQTSLEEITTQLGKLGFSLRQPGA